MASQAQSLGAAMLAKATLQGLPLHLPAAAQGAGALLLTWWHALTGTLLRMTKHRLTHTRSEVQQSARGAVAQGVTTGAGEGVAMPQQVVTLVEGSSCRQGGTTKPPTCPPPLPSFPCNPYSVYTLPSIPLRHQGQRQSKARRSEDV